MRKAALEPGGDVRPIFGLFDTTDSGLVSRADFDVVLMEIGFPVTTLKPASTIFSRSFKKR